LARKKKGGKDELGPELFSSGKKDLSFSRGENSKRESAPGEGGKKNFGGRKGSSNKIPASSRKKKVGEKISQMSEKKLLTAKKGNSTSRSTMGGPVQSTFGGGAWRRGVSFFSSRGLSRNERE